MDASAFHSPPPVYTLTTSTSIVFEDRRLFSFFAMICVNCKPFQPCKREQLSGHTAHLFGMFLERVNIHPRPVFRHRFDNDGTDEFQQAFLTTILPIPIVMSLMTLLLADVARECPSAEPPSFVPKVAEINSVFETGGRNCLLGSACREKAAMTDKWCVDWRGSSHWQWSGSDDSDRGQKRAVYSPATKEWPAKQPTVLPIVWLSLLAAGNLSLRFRS